MPHHLARRDLLKLPPLRRRRHRPAERLLVPPGRRHALAVPAIATLAVFTFISQWNNLLWPLVVSNSDATRTVAVGLQVFQDTNGTQWNLLLVAATITTVPLIVIFFLTQRWFVRGITMSGLGGR